MTEDELSNIVIGLAIKVHTSLWPGLLESVYRECLYYEISKSGFRVEKEKSLPVIYEDVKLDCGFRIDLLVGDKLLIELKSVVTLNDVHLAQTLTYLKLGDYRVGLLINFNVYRLKDGIKRVVNNL